ncbi:uncharacterized protein LOC127598188 [Hippocampus zosterae]|uniref:uncharacterized protein LOC127598188 n=1 Tax=Hippocampus zosterae TaxID=109293 RepID=UPI00223E03D1|nr:uncharacterized protein LOC127598188 [Hippocampus zosterae]
MDNVRANRPVRRTGLIALEIQKLGLDIVALSETRLPGAGQIEEPRHGYTFFWSGRAVEERRIHGVGFCIKLHLVRDHNIIPVRTSERLMSITLPLCQSQSLVIISAYAPTLDASEEAKESFYAALRGLILRVNPRDKLLVLGDFNARVGQDHQLWGGILGKEGVGNCNENGELLLVLCAETEMVITNTLFRMANKRKTTWQHPRSGHWHLIVYVLIRICDRADVMVTRAIRSMDDGWSDHRLVASRLRLKIAPAKRRKKIPKRIRFNVGLLRNPEVLEQYQTSLADKLDTQPRTLPAIVHSDWEHLKTALTKSAEEVLGIQKRRNPDWFAEKKGDKLDCGNYRGISLLSTAEKLICRILADRLTCLAERVLPESQAGFRPGRGTADMVFCARQLLVKCREQRREFHAIFYDLAKAFDSVPRTALWKVLERQGCPPKFISLIRMFHDGMKGCVLTQGEMTPPFPVRTGVKQRCTVAPTLFCLYIAALIHHVTPVQEHGITLRYQTEGSVFNLSRLRSKQGTVVTTVSELQYADDNAAVSNSSGGLQLIADGFAAAYKLGITDKEIQRVATLREAEDKWEGKNSDDLLSRSSKLF